MAENLTSAFGGDTLTVSDIMQDPTWLPERIYESLDGAFLEELLFRNGGTNDGVVAYREAASQFLNDDPEEIAEFAEIPVADMDLGPARTVIGQKVALAIRVSWEMRRFNRLDVLEQRVRKHQNTMIRNGIEAALGTFNANENVGTLVASDAWTAGGSDPVTDIFDAIEEIEAAGPEDSERETFGYVPDTLVMHPRVYTILFRNDVVQSKYIGDLASENPLYTGIKPNTMFGLNVATSRFMDPTQVLVLESGVAGFRSDAQPLTFTPFYEEGGNSGFGGANQSWRSDAFRHRVLALDNPRAVCRITGVTA